MVFQRWSLALLALCLCLTASARVEPEFRVLVPQFESDSDLGDNVAFALNHNIFRTFSHSIPLQQDGQFNPGDSCCLKYKAISRLAWPLAEQTHSDAYEAAKIEQAQVVLWGKAWNYGPDVVVQPFLTLASPPAGMQGSYRLGAYTVRHPFNADTGQWLIWEIEAEAETPGSAALSLTGFPNSRYELSPIIFDALALKQFSSFEGIKVYAEMSETSPVVGETGSNMTATHHVREWTRIKAPAGWITLPELASAETTVFIGGLVHFMRANWKRARISFEKVMQSEDAPTRIRVDAALLLAAALARHEPSCADCAGELRAAIEFAERINPYSLTTMRYALMAELEAARTSSDPDSWGRVQRRLADVRAASPVNDRFVQDAEAVVNALSPRQHLQREVGRLED